jgi:hypothetical protein
MLWRIVGGMPFYTVRIQSAFLVFFETKDTGNSAHLLVFLQRYA